MTIIALVDWISFTTANISPTLPRPSQFDGLSRKEYWKFLELSGIGKNGVGEWVRVKPNTPYAVAVMDTETKSRIEWGGGGKGALYSCTGTTCEFIRKNANIVEFIKYYSADVSRLDFAVDMYTDCTPQEFIEKRTNDHFKTVSNFHSPTGDTSYVGSWSSDRFSRVYRYAHPHERAEWLRAEHVFRRRQAKRIASLLVDHSVAGIAKAIGEIYGWSHEAWTPEKLGKPALEKIEAWKRERHASKTLQWLEDVAIPAAMRLEEEGEITNLEEWFKALVTSRKAKKADTMSQSVSR